MNINLIKIVNKTTKCYKIYQIRLDKYQKFVFKNASCFNMKLLQNMNKIV
jgi:hypothetical protein